MKHAATFVLLGIIGVLPGFGQATAQADSQTLQAILVEIRGLHNDVRLSETTQILLTELEMQQTTPRQKCRNCRTPGRTRPRSLPDSTSWQARTRIRSSRNRWRRRRTTSKLSWQL